MKLFVGLGNPGDLYSKNRHNVGFMVIDALNAKLASSFKKSHTISHRSQVKLLQAIITEYSKVILAKPLVFMNDAGLAVKKLVQRYKIKMDDLYVIHDDLDIPLGNYKIQKGKGPKDHNGVISVENELDRDDFIRVRVGIENRSKNLKVPGDIYVLQNFGLDEEAELDSVIKEVVREIVKSWL